MTDEKLKRYKLAKNIYATINLNLAYKLSKKTGEKITLVKITVYDSNDSNNSKITVYFARVYISKDNSISWNFINDLYPDEIILPEKFRNLFIVAIPDEDILNLMPSRQVQSFNNGHNNLFWDVLSKFQRK